MVATCRLAFARLDVATIALAGPTRITSPAASLRGAVIGEPLTSVPLRLPRSSTVICSPLRVMRAWRRDTESESIITSVSTCRPHTISAPSASGTTREVGSLPPLETIRYQVVAVEPGGATYGLAPVVVGS